MTPWELHWIADAVYERRKTEHWHLSWFFGHTIQALGMWKRKPPALKRLVEDLHSPFADRCTVRVRPGESRSELQQRIEEAKRNGK